MIPPVIIGGTGGSGTRVVVQIIRKAGFFMGENVNDAEDAKDFFEFYENWINQFLKVNKAIHAANEPKIEDLMREDFLKCICAHTKPIQGLDKNWGWKNPRSIYLLPFFHRMFPKMKYIHLIRDGRDMAYSSNQNQVIKHADIILGKEFINSSLVVRAAALWNAINLSVADYGEEYLHERYLQLLFEDLCFHPESTIQQVFKFLDFELDTNMPSLLSSIQVPSTMGRWKKQDSSELTNIELVAGEGLKRFGFL